MGQTLTVKTGVTNMWLGGANRNAGDVVIVSDDEYANLLVDFGSTDALDNFVTIGASASAPAADPRLGDYDTPASAIVP